MEEERKERNTEEGPADTAEIPAPEELEEAVTVPAGAGEDKDAAAGLEQKLNEANARVQQLERERFLLLRGVPEEDLDYCVFRIGKLVTEEKDFPTAAKEFLKSRESGPVGRSFRSGASLSAHAPKTPPSANETMNRLLRASR